MSDVLLSHWSLPDPELRSLIRRCELVPALLRRQVEEEIVALVVPNLEPSEELWTAFHKQHNFENANDAALEEWLEQRGWDHRDLCLHLLRPTVLERFKEQRYGPGVEELFLAKKNELDSVIYSLLRVKDTGLARELWISLSEGEVAFAELAARYSDGPEAQTKGVIGPRPLGSIEPAIAERLRSLRAGQLRPPEALGEWHVLLRLESLNPARLDQPTRQKLLQEQFELWISQRVDAILAGEVPDPLHFDPDA
ncbi:peptidylprolyl isomerase [Synechococcus sp. A15-60]|uniref:peptidylprolyl isomerase n=1 Tax=Synechococcus sp. A15-60 TaxID=1050655 RepID=UPI0016480E51|nr:peptidylprolyl isomerase [Synechococcus sp. A15-60]QNI46833.1 hypothetical protein SynA1560_00135 [Synechococcus sp. A15-60]